MVVFGVELIYARRQIDAMIKADPFMVSLRRRPRVKGPDGAWTWGVEQLLAPQQGRLIPFKRRMTEFLQNTEFGDVPDLPYVLLGRHDFDLQRGDRFTYNGQEFEVQTIDIHEPEVKTAAHVDYFGGNVNG